VPPPLAERVHSHSGLAQAVFWTKSRLLVGARLLRNAVAGEPFRPLRRLPAIPAGATLLAEDATRLYSATDPRERELELGKVQNLRVAAAAVDGIVIGPGAPFSFWRALGRPGRAKGYVIGRELRLGCLIPSIAGGICQLSRALSRAATEAGLTIVERHRHTAPAEIGFGDENDSTVFWNYIDLRFAAERPVRVGARLTGTHLIVRLDALP
jgi:vancomycin resistance protein VanW